MTFTAKVKEIFRHHLVVHASDVDEAHRIIMSNSQEFIDCIFSDSSEIEIEDLQSELKEEVDDGC